MKIIIINGSPRVNGSTHAILSVFQSHLEKKADVQVQYIHLSKMNMTYCTGCNLCFKNGQCYMNDDAEKVSNEIALADGIIIGSPTYASNISAQVKTLIDRGHFVIEQLLVGKYTVGVITSENYGSKTACKILKNLFSYSGAFISATITQKLSFTKTPKLSNATEIKIEKQAEKFYCDIKQEHIYWWQKLKHKNIFHFGIKPFVLKKGDSYQGVIHRWKRSL